MYKLEKVIINNEREVFRVGDIVKVTVREEQKESYTNIISEDLTVLGRLVEENPMTYKYPNRIFLDISSQFKSFILNIYLGDIEHIERVG